MLYIKVLGKCGETGKLIISRTPFWEFFVWTKFSAFVWDDRWLSLSSFRSYPWWLLVKSCKFRQKSGQTWIFWILRRAQSGFPLPGVLGSGTKLNKILLNYTGMPPSSGPSTFSHSASFWRLYNIFSYLHLFSEKSLVTGLVWFFKILFHSFSSKFFTWTTGKRK